MFQTLSELVEQRDSDVINLVAAINKSLGAKAVSKNFLRLEAHLKSFQFAKAKKMLAQTAKELGL